MLAALTPWAAVVVVMAVVVEEGRALSACCETWCVKSTPFTRPARSPFTITECASHGKWQRAYGSQNT